MILIVDGNNQAFVSNMSKSLSTGKGFPTQAIHGFFKALGLYNTTFQPKKFIVAWDGGNSDQRMELYPEYKAERKERKKDPMMEKKWEEFLQQAPVIKELLKNLGVIQLQGRGCEADDLIAVTAQSVAEQGQSVVIISSDKDFYQLISPFISIFSPMGTATNRHITNENMQEITGLRPDQWLEFRSMMGDKSDGIPGVNGIGEKTALGIMQKFGNVATFLQAIAEHDYKPSRYEKAFLKEGAGKDYTMSRKMMNLTAGQIAADVSLANMEVHPVDVNAAYSGFLKLEMAEIVANWDNWVKIFC